MTYLNAGDVKTFSFHGTSAAPDGVLPTDPWEAMASRAGLSPQVREGGGASGRGEGAAFPRRLRRKNYVRRSPLSKGENSYLKTHARALESCWLMSTAHVYRLSPILRLLSLYFF